MFPAEHNFDGLGSKTKTTGKLDAAAFGLGLGPIDVRYFRKASGPNRYTLVDLNGFPVHIPLGRTAKLALKELNRIAPDFWVGDESQDEEMTLDIADEIFTAQAESEVDLAPEDEQLADGALLCYISIRDPNGCDAETQKIFESTCLHRRAVSHTEPFMTHKTRKLLRMEH